MALRALDGAEVSGSLGALGEALLCDIIGELGVPAFWNHRWVSECVWVWVCVSE
jgi:hypothetical protein